MERVGESSIRVKIFDIALVGSCYQVPPRVEVDAVDIALEGFILIDQ